MILAKNVVRAIWLANGDVGSDDRLNAMLLDVSEANANRDIYILIRLLIWYNILKMKIHFRFFLLHVIFRRTLQMGAAVAEWLSSWLAEQEDRSSIPRLATWIFRDWLSPASKSRYGWKIAKSTLIKTTKPTKRYKWKIHNRFNIFYCLEPVNIRSSHITITSLKICNISDYQLNIL